MAGNAVYRHTNTAILTVAAVDAPEIVTSAQFDDQLAPTLERLGLRRGLLEDVAGITERRWWPTDVTFAEAAAMAGAKALAESGVDPEKIGLLVDTSVCRDHLEPSAAVDVHHRLGLGSHCLNFDLANACLGFVNGMQLAAMMIDSGQIDYALVVDGEGSRRTQERTLERLAAPETTAGDLFAEFATLTLGSGSAAMVLGRADAHAGGHRLLGGVSRAATEFNGLCVGDLDRMRTDTKGLLEAGLDVSEVAWADAATEFSWNSADRYVIHQVSSVHTAAMCQRLGLDTDRVPLIFPTRGNVGPAAIPITLALETHSLNAGDQVLVMGMGSGINAAVAEIAW